jgi:hypothetical protein
VVTDGGQVLRFVCRAGSSLPGPGLIMFGLNLSGRDRLEVLAELRADPGRVRLPGA